MKVFENEEEAQYYVENKYWFVVKYGDIEARLVYEE